jgi:hypothetical protein
LAAAFLDGAFDAAFAGAFAAGLLAAVAFVVLGAAATVSSTGSSGVAFARVAVFVDDVFAGVLVPAEAGGVVVRVAIRTPFRSFWAVQALFCDSTKTLVKSSAEALS